MANVTPTGRGCPENVRRADAEEPFVPTRAQLAYLVAYKDLRSRGLRATAEHIAKEIGRTRGAVEKLLYRGGAPLRQWLTRELTAEFDELWIRATHRLGQLACEGSVAHFEAFGRAIGRYPAPRPAGAPLESDGTGGVLVFSLIPQREV